MMDQVENLKRIIWQDLNRLEHRAGVLMEISDLQREAGHHDIAKAYRRQAAESNGRAQFIRELLSGTI